MQEAKKHAEKPEDCSREPLLHLNNELVPIACINRGRIRDLRAHNRFQRSMASWIYSHLIHPGGPINQTFIYYEPKFISRCLDAWKVHAFDLINHDDVSHCICR